MTNKIAAHLINALTLATEARENTPRAAAALRYDARRELDRAHDTMLAMRFGAPERARAKALIDAAATVCRMH